MLKHLEFSLSSKLPFRYNTALYVCQDIWVVSLVETLDFGLWTLDSAALLRNLRVQKVGGAGGVEEWDDERGW